MFFIRYFGFVLQIHKWYKVNLKQSLTQVNISTKPMFYFYMLFKCLQCNLFYIIIFSFILYIMYPVISGTPL